MQLVALDHLGEIAQEQSEGQRLAGLGPGTVRRGPAWRRIGRLADRYRRIPLLGRVPLALTVVLAVQAAASLRLVWTNTAFADEALYLWAGHLDWAGWLGAVPAAVVSKAALPTYFSGAPVIYPPIGALADSVGGLAGARLLSLAFMLAATCLLYASTRRLFDPMAAGFAVALFAGVGSTQFLGAFATYDAMALLLLALATWAGVRAAASTPRGAAAFLVLSGAALALADATKYAATLFTPVVVGVTLLALWRLSGRRRAAWGTATQAGVAIAAIGGALLAGGHAYWAGIAMTTLSRSSGTEPMPGVLFLSAKWAGGIAFLAICGALATAWSGGWSRRLLGCLLTLAVFLAPVEQARIHTVTSLYKHVGYGAWFACAIAGLGLAALARVVPSAKVAAATRVAVITMAAVSVSGFWYAGAHFAVWPDSSRYVATLEPWLVGAHRQVLIDTASIPEYYLRDANFAMITNSSYFAYTDPGTGRRLTDPVAAYSAAIRDGYFAVISLTDGNAPTIYDPGIIRDIARYGGYQLVSAIPYHTPADDGRFLTWVRMGQYQTAGPSGMGPGH